MVNSFSQFLWACHLPFVGTIALLAVGVAAVFRTISPQQWARGRTIAESAQKVAAPPLLALGAWVPLAFHSGFSHTNPFGVALVACLCLRVIMFSNKVHSMQTGGTDSWHSSCWLLLCVCWLSVACIWATMAPYYYYLPTMFVEAASPMAKCDPIRPLSTTPMADYLGLMFYAAGLAVHSFIWRRITREPSTSVHKLMKEAAGLDFNGYALVFFNVKQFYLWFLQAIDLGKTYPDPVVQLAAYMEILHSFKTALLMYRVLSVLYPPEKPSDGTLSLAAEKKRAQQRWKRWTILSALLLSSVGALVAYILAEPLVATYLHLKASFVTPLVMISVLEVLLDWYLLQEIFAELRGMRQPLRKSFLVAAGDHSSDEDEDEDEDERQKKEALADSNLSLLSLAASRLVYGDHPPAKDGLAGAMRRSLQLVMGQNKDASGSCCNWCTRILCCWPLNQAISIISCTAMSKRFWKTVGFFAAAVVVGIIVPCAYDAPSYLAFLTLPATIFICCGVCSLRLQISCLNRLIVMQRRQGVAVFTLLGFSLFIVMAAADGPASDLVLTVYTMAAFVCWCRISMFSLKVDCFRRSSKLVVQELKEQWFFAAGSFFVAAILITVIALWPNADERRSEWDDDDAWSGASVVDFWPWAMLLWLLCFESCAWYYSLRCQKKLSPLIGVKVSYALNPTQITIFNFKQFYLWIVFAFSDAQTYNSYVIGAHLMAFTEVLHSFKSLIFVGAVFDSIQRPKLSKALLAAMTVCFVTALLLFLAATYHWRTNDDKTAFLLFCICVFLFVLPELCADLYVLRWWTATEDRLLRSSDDTRSTELAIMHSDEQQASIPADNSGAEPHGQEEKANSSAPLDDNAVAEQASSMAKVSKAISVTLVCMSLLLALVSSQVSLNSFERHCLSGRGSEADRVQTTNVFAVLSALHSSPEGKCADVWAQRCQSSCKWRHLQSGAPGLSLVCDQNYELINITARHISGTISTSLSRLTSLRSIDFRGWFQRGRDVRGYVRGYYTGLVGTIPPQLSTLSSLTSLDLSGNVLVGTIPPQLSALSLLTSLNLSGNALNGSIPSAFGMLAALQTLDLAYNRVCNAKNKYDGCATLCCFPGFQCKINNVTECYNWRGLSGAIPSQLSQLSRLSSLNLSFNTFSGAVPGLPVAQYTRGCNLQTSGAQCAQAQAYTEHCACS